MTSLAILPLQIQCVVGQDGPVCPAKFASSTRIPRILMSTTQSANNGVGAVRTGSGTRGYVLSFAAKVRSDPELDNLPPSHPRMNDDPSVFIGEFEKAVH